jgi:hypothetical protein
MYVKSQYSSSQQLLEKNLMQDELNSYLVISSDLAHSLHASSSCCGGSLFTGGWICATLNIPIRRAHLFQ